MFPQYIYFFFKAEVTLVMNNNSLYLVYFPLLSHCHYPLLPHQMQCQFNLDREMAARHRCRGRSIQIIRTDVLPVNKCIRPQTKQFLVNFLRKPSPYAIINPFIAIQAQKCYRLPTNNLKVHTKWIFKILLYLIVAFLSNRTRRSNFHFPTAVCKDNSRTSLLPNALRRFLVELFCCCFFIILTSLSTTVLYFVPCIKLLG